MVNRTDNNSLFPFNRKVAHPDMIGHYARSIESGWLGKIIAIEGDMCKMQGVNELCFMVAGGKVQDWLDTDDFQWFDPYDLKFIGV